MRKIDWGYYTQLLYWEKPVACALSLAKDPESFERDYRNDGSSVGADNRRKFDQRMELLTQAIASEQVFSAPLAGMRYPLHVRPAEFAKWAQGIGLSLPAQMIQLVPATVAADAEPVQPANAAAQPPAANPSYSSKPLQAQTAREAGQRILDANPSLKIEAVARQLHGTVRGRGGKALSVETIRKQLAGIRPVGTAQRAAGIAQNSLGDRRMPKPKTKK